MSLEPSQVLRCRRNRRRIARRSTGGFTLVEVLATIMLLAVVMPVAMEAVSISTDTARLARSKTEATALAESKLAELVTGNEWQSGVLAGDFGNDWPEYRWSATAQTWASPYSNTYGSDPLNTINEIDLQVIWKPSGASERSVTLSTLVYAPNVNNNSSTSTSTGSSSSGKTN